MDLVALTVVWVGTHALGERVARIPVRWEVGVTICKITSVDVLRETRFLVYADSAALLP